MSSDFPDDPASGPLPRDPSIQAGEYVLGTLAPAERAAFATRLLHDNALQQAVDSWEARLLPLTALVEPVSPSPGLWQRIDRSIGAAHAQTAPAMPQARSATTAGAAAAAAPDPATTANPAADRAPRRSNLPRRRFDWDSLALWRLLTAGALALSMVLGVLLVQRMAVPAVPQFMVVLVGPQDKAPGWVIQANLQRQLNLIPLGSATVPQDKALQFWTKGEGWSGPVSLGLVRPGQTVQIPLDRLPSLQPNQLFELTLEPVTGSPTGRPTGPVQFIGRAVKVM